MALGRALLVRRQRLVHLRTHRRRNPALGTQAELATLDQVLATTRSWSCGDPTRDAIASWVADNPRTAIEHHEIWHDLLAVVAWIADDHRDRAHLDLRHLDVPGVDTKFVERHRKASTIVTSNREPVEWLALMADPLLAQSAVDRLKSAAYELVVDGDSYRNRQKPTLTT